MQNKLSQMTEARARRINDFKMEQDEAVAKARGDLAERLGVAEDAIEVESIDKTDFPDSALGAPVEEEMSAQMITPGWRIRFAARGTGYEYRASRYSLRLYMYDGENHRID